MAQAACPHCGCNAGAGAPVHALLTLLAMDAVDAALDARLLEAAGCDLKVVPVGHQRTVEEILAEQRRGDT